MRESERERERQRERERERERKKGGAGNGIQWCVWRDQECADEKKWRCEIGVFDVYKWRRRSMGGGVKLNMQHCEARLRREDVTWRGGGAVTVQCGVGREGNECSEVLRGVKSGGGGGGVGTRDGR